MAQNEPLSDDALRAIRAEPDSARLLRLLTPDERQRFDQLDQSSRPSALSRFIEPIAQIPGNALSFLGTMATDPKAAGQALVDPSVDQLDQMQASYQQGDPLAALGHAAASAPFVGPVIAHGVEQMRGGDVAGGAGTLTATAAPFVAGPLSRMAGRGVAAGLRATGAAEPLAALADQASTTRMVDTIGPKVGPNKLRFNRMAADVAPALARDPELGAFSREGLQTKVEAKLADAEAGLDAAAEARGPSAQVKTAPILQALDAKMAKLSTAPLEASRLVPEVSSPGVRSVGENPMRQYALQWMKEDMESLPFVKKTFNEPGRGQGGSLNVVGGAAGAPIYRMVVGQEGQEIISASRSQVAKAIADVMAGNTEGRLRQLVVGVADDLARGDRTTQRAMATGGPDAQGVPPEHPYRQITKDRPADAPERGGRPLGQSVDPAPNASQLTALKQIRSEVERLGPVASYESVRRIRQAWDQVAKSTYSPALTTDYLTKNGEKLGASAGTGVLRDALATASPESAAANATYTLYRTASDVLQATQETEQARPRVGRGMMARATGAMVGAKEGGIVGAGLGAIVGQMAERAAQMAPTFQIMIARRLAGVADMLRNGDTAGAQATVDATIRKFPIVKGGLKLSGQLAPAAGQVMDLPRAADGSDPRDQTGR